MRIGVGCDVEVVAGCVVLVGSQFNAVVRINWARICAVISLTVILASGVSPNSERDVLTQSVLFMVRLVEEVGRVHEAGSLRGAYFCWELWRGIR